MIEVEEIEAQHGAAHDSGLSNKAWMVGSQRCSPVVTRERHLESGCSAIVWFQRVSGHSRELKRGLNKPNGEASHETCDRNTVYRPFTTVYWPVRLVNAAGPSDVKLLVQI